MNEFTEEQRKNIKSAIEGLGQQYYEAMELEKENLKILSVKVEEECGLKAATFRKYVKTLYLENLEEEKAKADEFYEGYKGIMDDHLL
jgi:hypothetical protein